MKQRVNLTIDPDVIRRAHKLAHERHISISQLVENYLRHLPPESMRDRESFIEKWAGKLKLAPQDKYNARRESLLAHYDLISHASSD